MAKDLKIPTAQLKPNLLPPGAQPADYFQPLRPVPMRSTWFGKVPPDLSLIARSRGPGLSLPVPQDLLRGSSAPRAPTTWRLTTPPCPRCCRISKGSRPRCSARRQRQVFDHFVTAVPGQLSSAQFDQLRARHRQFPGLCRRAGAAGSAHSSASGWCCSCCLFTWLAWLLEEGILEGRALILRAWRQWPRRRRILISYGQSPFGHDSLFRSR